jgi:hypothetical protein
MNDAVKSLPLQDRASIAWSLAYRGRHSPNWAQLLDARNQLEREFLNDKHPTLRRLAGDFKRTPSIPEAA